MDNVEDYCVYCGRPFGDCPHVDDTLFEEEFRADELLALENAGIEDSWYEEVE